MRFSILIIIPFLLFGCNKPQPTPELRDPIYLDLVTKLQNTEKDLIEARGQLQEQVEAKKKVIPQTGQNKFADKRFFAAENRIALIEQQKKYFTILVEQRKMAARKSYLDAFYAKRPWPDSAEFEEYQSKNKAEAPARPWNQAERINEYKKKMGFTDKPAGGHGGTEPAKAAEPSGH